MADEKLMFPIGFDLESGVDKAIQDWNKQQQKLSQTIGGKPIKVKITTDSSSFSEVENASKKAGDTAKKSFVGSALAADSYKAKLKELTIAWNNLTAAQRGGTEGRAIIDQYRQLSNAAKGNVSTIRSAANMQDKQANATKRATNEIKSQNAAYNTQIGYVSRLVTRLGVYSAIFAGLRMITNIRETTAEFELQRVALGAIIQDAQKAGQLFSQIKAAAVESPFEIKDLVSYTKQLSAYRIETENLFDTTMRLADVSAGLSVDMGRLILAYGQVKAASVLRGQELRQFTEAGIPLVQLLADKFSILRGQMVSTGEVFELISNRAVSFSMVKDIFEDMTNAGGMFYDMQKKQAKTLAGEWSNLRDAISIAYDEMGRDVYSPMRNTVGFMRELIQNWRDVVSVVTSVSAAYLAYSIMAKSAATASAALSTSEAISLAVKNRQVVTMPRFLALLIGETNAKVANATATKLQTVSHIKAATATNILSKGFWRLTAAMLSNPYTLIIAAIAGLVTWLITADNATKRLNKELKSIESEGIVKSDSLARNFKRLADEAVNAANGSNRQKEALDELQRTYSNILTPQQLTIEGLKEMKGSYEAITSAIYDKIKAQTLENQISAIQEKYTKDISKQEADLAESLKLAPTIEGIGLTSEEIDRVLAETKRQFDEGLISIEDDALSKTKKIASIISSQTYKTVYFNQLYSFIRGDIDTLITTYDEFGKKVKDVTDKMNDSYGALGRYAEGFKKAKESGVDAADKLNQANFTTKFEFDEAKTAAELKSLRDFVQNTLKSEFKIDMDLSGAIDFNSLRDSLKNIPAQFKPAVLEMVRLLESSISESLLSPSAKIVQETFKQALKGTKVTMDDIDGYLKDNETSWKDYVEKLKGYISDLIQRQTEMVAQNERNIALSKASGGLITPFLISDEEIAKVANQLQVLQDVLSKVEPFVADKPTGGDGGDRRLSLLKEEVSMVETVYKRYQEFLKYMGKEAAQNKIAKLFGADGKVKGTRFELPFSAEDIRKQYKAAQDIARSLPKSEKTVLEFGIKIDDSSFDQLKDQITSNLDRLSSEIERQQTSKNFFEKMLGITGDRELAMTLTMSIYGDMGAGLADKMKEQLKEAFKGIDLKGLESQIDISKFISGDKIDYAGLEALLETQDVIDKLGTEGVKVAQKLVKEGQSEWAKYVESLYSSLSKFQTFEERRTQIVSQGEAERMRIMQESGLPSAELDKMLRASEKAQAEALSKVNIEEFKAGDDWIRTFEDMDRVATPTIERIMGKLKEFIELNKESMSPEQLKTLMSEYQKMNEEIEERNPFKALSEGIGEYVDATKDIKTYTKEVADSERELSEASKEKADAEAKFISGQGDVLELGRKYADSIKAETKAKDKNKKATDNLADAENRQKAGLSKLASGFQNASNAINSMQNLLSQVTELLGVTEDSEAGAFVKDLSKGLGIMATALAVVAGMIILVTTVSTPLLIVAAALAVAFAAFSFFSNMKVRKANKEIERQQELIDKLSYSYGRLQKAAEDALGVDAITNYNEQYENLLAQAAAAEKQAAAERSKGKKEDEEKTKEYMDAARDARDEAADLMKDFSKQIFGVGLADYAKDIASVWLEAKLSGENTMDALNKKWKETMRDMVANTLMAKAIEAALKPVFDKIDELAESPSLIEDPNWWAGLAGQLATSMENSDEILTNLYKILEQQGINLKEGESTLTGISKNIANASEESILTLAAGINTQNFYISGIYQIVNEIKAVLMQGGTGGVDFSSLITVQNSYLQQLPNIALHTANTVAECRTLVLETRRIADNLDRVIKPLGVKSGHAINTQLN